MDSWKLHFFETSVDVPDAVASDFPYGIWYGVHHDSCPTANRCAVAECRVVASFPHIPPQVSEFGKWGLSSVHAFEERTFRLPDGPFTDRIGTNRP